MVRLMDAQGVIIFRFEEEGYPVVIATNLFVNGSKAAGSPCRPCPPGLTQPLLEGQRLLLPDLPEQRSMRS